MEPMANRFIFTFHFDVSFLKFVFTFPFEVFSKANKVIIFFCYFFLFLDVFCYLFFFYFHGAFLFFSFLLFFHAIDYILFYSFIFHASEFSF